MDLGSFLTRAISISKSTAGDDYSARERTAEVLRSFLQILLTPGLNPDIDAICRDRLGLAATQASVGFHRFGLGPQQLKETILTLYDQESGEHPDCVGKFTKPVVYFWGSVGLPGVSPDSLFAHFDAIRK